MSTCTCQSGPAAGESAPTDLEQAVAEVIQASASDLDTKFSAVLARLDALDALLAPPADPDGEPADPVTASTSTAEDTADSRVRELENRLTSVEEAISALYADTTPEMSEI